MSDCFGYKGELFILNAYDCVRMLKNDFNDKDRFFVLKNGVSNCIKDSIGINRSQWSSTTKFYKAS